MAATVTLWAAAKPLLAEKGRPRTAATGTQGAVMDGRDWNKKKK